MKRKVFIFKNFGHRFKIFVEQAFTEWQLSQNKFYRLLQNIQCFLPLTKIKRQKNKSIGEEKMCVKSKT